ncbi:MAG: SMP-30/gluconolactonase/LRE family protein [Planctomycetota bacterium]|nr:SMP-30/gluconolactonase/LRE family protein [Planctomycetota bacterium]
MPRLFIVIATLLAISTLTFAADFLIKNGAEFAKLLPQDAKVQKLATGFKFLEGPTWLAWDGGFLVFSDIPANHIKKWTAKDGITVFRDNSNAANGNTTDRNGNLFTCEHTARRLTLTTKDGSTTVLTDKSADGNRYSSPNDLVVHSNGSVYFTDPPYGLPRTEKKEQPGNYVFRYDPKTKQSTPVVKDFDMPNGVAFSPDEKKIYIADSGRPHHIRVFDVNDDGSLSNGKIFAVIDKGGPDGIRTDSAGRLWSSAADGVHIFAPTGELIGKILVPESPANLCFGGPTGTTLFITARTSLYSIQTNVAGTVK